MVAAAARLGEGFAGDSECCARQPVGQVCGVGGNDADCERGAEAGGEFNAGGDAFKRGFGECLAGFIYMCQYENRFHYSAPIHSTSSAAIWSGVRSLTTRVVRCCFGRLTETYWRPLGARVEGLAFCRAGLMVRMLAMPTCGLLRGSASLPVGPPRTAGGPA